MQILSRLEHRAKRLLLEWVMGRHHKGLHYSLKIRVGLFGKVLGLLINA